MTTTPKSTLNKARFLEGLENEFKASNLIGSTLKATRCSFLASKFFKLQLLRYEEQTYLVERMLAVAQDISAEKYPTAFCSSEDKLGFMLFCNLDFFKSNGHLPSPLSNGLVWKDEIELNNPYFIHSAPLTELQKLLDQPTYRITKQQFTELIDAMVEFVQVGK